MSKKHRTRSQRRSFPWPLAAFGGVLLILAAVLFARSSVGAPASAAEQSGSGEGRIAVDQQKIDYGYVKFGNNETFRIKVTNTGSGPLRFADHPYIEVLEGC
jgi:hypothetical protein